MALIKQRIVEHNEYGIGVTREWTRDANGKVIFLVRWQRADRGVSGGWYAAKSLSFKKEDR